MNITDVYDKYNVLPVVRTHQFRVSAVAQFIGAAEITEIVSALLIHDIAKIVEPTFQLQEEELAWTDTQNKMRAKYGTDAMHATYAIARELGLSDRVLELIGATGFANSVSVYESRDLGKMICLYADQRVSPKGIVTIEQRIHDGQERFRRKPQAYAETQTEFEAKLQALRDIEVYIFSKETLRSEQISDDAIKHYVTNLQTYEISR